MTWWTSCACGSGNLLAMVRSMASGKVRVVYHYTPSNAIAPGQYTIKAAQGAGATVKIGTFDTNPDAAQAVQAGKIEWFIDQQPYLQGYMAITQLYLYKKNGNILGGGEAVLTGPSFVDKSNIGQVLPFIKQNTR